MMNLRRPALHSVIVLLMLSAGVLQGCKDNDFSFDNIDATVGLGTDTIALPGGNTTKDIPLDDVVHLNSSNFVYIDNNGDYQIRITDNSVSSSSVTIDPFTINVSTSTTNQVPIIVGTFTGTIVTASMTASVPTDVQALSSVACDNNLTVTFTVPSTVHSIDAMTFSFPSFLHIDRATLNGKAASVSNSTVSLTNVATGNHSLVLHVTSIAFGETSDLGSATFDRSAHRVNLSAAIRLQGTLSSSQVTSTGSLSTISGNFKGSLAVTSAKGRFNPSYSFGSFGSVQLDSIPDFLSDKSVLLDLYDPHIQLNITTTLPLAAKVNGRLIARDAHDKVLANVLVPTFTVPAGNSVVVLHKQNEAAPAGETYVSVPELDKLMETIPDHIDFTDVRAVADDSQTAELQLGHAYTMSERYVFTTPLQLDADAAIAYTDSIDDLNKTLKKLSFKEKTIGDASSIDGHLRLEADIENRIPAYLTLTAWGTDLQGDSIPESLLTVDVDKTVEAATDVQSPKTTHLTVTITPHDNDVLHSMDGMRFRFRATASDAEGKNPIVGKTINAKTQTITVRNLKLYKVGKLVGNFN